MRLGLILHLPVTAMLLVASTTALGADTGAREVGERFNLEKYEQCMEEGRKRYGLRANFTHCEVYRLRRPPAPEYWPPNSRKPELPPAFQDTGYRPGMTAKQYFEHLCKTEAGEFVYKAVRNVDGFYQVRPRKYATPDLLSDRYVMEDPYGHTALEQRSAPAMFLGPGTYRYIEVPLQGGIRVPGWSKETYHPSMLADAPSKALYRVYRLEDSKYVQEFVSEIRSRYAFTWREIRRPMDRELGIAGGELIVVDLLTGDLLGIRRGFMWAAKGRGNSVNWDSGAYCPVLKNKPRGLQWDKDVSFTRWFILQVLRPIEQSRQQSNKST